MKRRRLKTHWGRREDERLEPREIVKRIREKFKDKNGKNK